MKPFITTITSSPSTIQTKTILSRDGITCSLVSLAPGDKTPVREPDHSRELLLHVIEGPATVCFDGVNTVVDQDHALLIPKGRAHCISASATRHAKLLRVEIPPQRLPSPEIITLGS